MMMVVFLTAFLIGTVVLAMAVVLGDHGDLHHDLDHDAPGFFNLKVVMAFLAGYGAIGMLATFYDAPPMAASIVGLAGGVGLGFGIRQALVWIAHQQGGTVPESDFLIGQQGTLLVGVAPTQLGEVAIRMPGGQTQTLLARPDDGKSSYLPGDTVIVINIVGGIALVHRSLAEVGGA